MRINSYPCNLLTTGLLLSSIGSFTFNKSYTICLGVAANVKTATETDQSTICTKDFKDNLRVCSASPTKSHTHSESDGNRLHVLSFELNDNVLKLTFYRNQVYLPGATVSNSKTYNGEELHFYHQIISRELNHYYIGSLVFRNLSVPFSAERIEERSFIASISLFETKIELSCTPDAWMKLVSPNNQCSMCQVHCTTCVTCKGEANVPHDSHVPDRAPLPLQDNADFKSMMNSFIQNTQVITTNNERMARQSEKKQRGPVSCALQLIADHLFHTHIGNGDALRTIKLMLTMVNRLDAIFRPVDFDGNGTPDNIGFLVKRVNVLNSTEVPESVATKAQITSRDILQAYSSAYNFSDVCLCIIFTFRDFGGTAGSAYPAYASSSLAGGICQKIVKSKSKNTSFNTVVVTSLLDGKQRRSRDVLLTLAHEVGHSFGAHHDHDFANKECYGNAEHGRYIMSSTTNRGYQVNNYKFSMCSVRAMLPVITKKGDCFIRGAIRPHCGNAVPEEGEECDCGWSSNCDQIDPCCTPADHTSGSDRPCTLRRSLGKVCSPVVSPCCTNACTYTTKTENRICNGLRQCSQVQKCNGTSSTCPESFTSDGVLCNNGSQVCMQGECSVKTCRFYKLSACVCSGFDVCQVCCKKNNTCIPFKYLNFTIDSQSCNGGVCAFSRYCMRPERKGVSPADTWVEILDGLTRHLMKHWLQYAGLGVLTLLLAIALGLSYKFEDSDHMKSMRYGKMLAIHSQGEQLGKVYDKILSDIDSHFTEAIRRTETKTLPMEYIEATSRLKALFPHISVEYLTKVVKISASEETAVKLLVIQGFKMKKFSE